MIDLDNLDMNNEEGKDSSVNSSDLNLATRSASIEDNYDRFTKLIYVIDVSASMSDGLLDLSSINDFHWDAGALERLRVRIENAKCRMSAAEESEAWDSDDSEDEDAPVVAGVSKLYGENPLNDLFWLGISELPLELQKPHIIASGDAWREIGLRAKHDYEEEGLKEIQAPMTKIDAVKRMAQKMVDERFEKFPDADIHLMTFEDVTNYSKPKNRLDLLAQIQACTAYGGNTRIALAVATAIRLCKKSPSPVQTHHIVLVTDGKDPEIWDMKNLLPEMKSLHIVLDVIHVSSPHEVVSGYGRDGAILEECCAASGGKFTKVTRMGDFETRFIEASRRLCLPAPSKA